MMEKGLEEVYADSDISVKQFSSLWTAIHITTAVVLRPSWNLIPVFLKHKALSCTTFDSQRHNKRI
jgi:hypothetical protein